MDVEAATIAVGDGAGEGVVCLAAFFGRRIDVGFTVRCFLTGVLVSVWFRQC